MAEPTLQWMFQRVEVINLKSRPDRLARFYESLPEDWPFRQPCAFAAIDGSRVPVPAHWVAGEGAWGCFRSHYEIIERALNDGVESLMVLEDDAICARGFGSKVRVDSGTLRPINASRYFRISDMMPTRPSVSWVTYFRLPKWGQKFGS